jgi:hypothetical protein
MPEIQASAVIVERKRLKGAGEVSAQHEGWYAARCRAGREGVARQRAVGPNRKLGGLLSVMLAEAGSTQDYTLEVLPRSI